MGSDIFHFDLEPSDVDRVRVEHAYMIARRGWPIEADIGLDDSGRRIVCRIDEPGGLANSAALVLQVELPGIGNLKLRTTLLPPRAEPYDLMLELARERMRHFLHKCEDWQMFAPGIAIEAFARFEQGRARLAEAVLAPDRASEVALAREAVVAAVQAGEMLARNYADGLLHARYGASAASETALGFRVDPRVPPPAEDLPEFREFGVVMIETPWNVVQPEQGRFEFECIDLWIDWARRHQRPVLLGPLVDLRPEAIPEWARSARDDYSSFCRLIWEHQEQVVARYAEHVAIWCVASGVHVNRFAPLTHEQMIDLTRRSAVLVRQARRSAKVLVELVQPFDDQVGQFRDSVRGYEYAVRALDEGVHIDCFGLCFECGLNRNGSEARDLLSFSDAIDGMGRLDRPMMITGFCAPAGSDEPEAGSWIEPWTPERQANWASTMFGIILGKMTHRGDTARGARVGVVESVLWSRFQESEGEPPLGLLDATGAPRRVLAQLAAVRRVIRRPIGRSAGRQSPLANHSEGARK
ncbi:MAG: hypothetical protein MK082_06695 [Phycisphaerales bacterium]|nr:hypothetical protein [Phycisphaerales bacterium]